MDPGKQRLIDILENRSKDPGIAEVRGRYLAGMKLPKDGVVADIGCGTGAVARAIAGLKGFKGRVVGIDSDAELLEAAREFADAEGVTERIEFRTGDAHALEFEDASLDGVTAQTALSHMHDPSKVLGEVRRVLKPGARIAIFDGDYESRAFSIPDQALARKVEAAWRAMPGHAPRLTRDLPRLLHRLRFEVEEVIPFVEFSIGEAGSWLATAERVIPGMIEAGSLSAEEAALWGKSIVEDSNRGTFFTASNYYAFVARKP